MNENLNLMNSYNYHPKTREELIKLIEERIKEEGNEVDLNDIDVSKITDMSNLFSYSDFNGDISKWDVSNVTNMSFMFFECEKFDQDISGWNVSKVTDMAYMFGECYDFNQDLSKWNISKVTDMEGIFYRCSIEDKYKPTIFDDKSQDITERIKTFHDAYCELGNEHPFVKSYEKYVNTASGEEADVIAFLKLRIICAALNEGWNPTLNIDEHRYCPWFCVYTQSEYEELDEGKKKECFSIIRASDNMYTLDNIIKYTHVYNGGAFGQAFSDVRLALRTKELAKYCGKQFIDIWGNYLIG